MGTQSSSSRARGDRTVSEPVFSRSPSTQDKSRTKRGSEVSAHTVTMEDLQRRQKLLPYGHNPRQLDTMLTYNPVFVECFGDMLKHEFCEEYIEFWRDVDRYRARPRLGHARHIVSEYLRNSSPCSVVMGSDTSVLDPLFASLEQQSSADDDVLFDTELFDEAVLMALELMCCEVYPRFFRTKFVFEYEEIMAPLRRKWLRSRTLLLDHLPDKASVLVVEYLDFERVVAYEPP